MSRYAWARETFSSAAISVAVRNSRLIAPPPCWQEALLVPDRRLVRRRDRGGHSLREIALAYVAKGGSDAVAGEY